MTLYPVSKPTGKASTSTANSPLEQAAGVLREIDARSSSVDGLVGLGVVDHEIGL